MIDVGDNGKIADVCAFHEDGLSLYSSILPVRGPLIRAVTERDTGDQRK
jgi:hypothetical protein